MIWLLLIFTCLTAPACAQDSVVLKGSVEETEAARTRIHRFEDPTQSDSQQLSKTRLHRVSASQGMSASEKNSDMLPEFASVDPGLFTATTSKPFDLEAESNSRDLMLAWDLWHKQLSSAIYNRFHVLGAGGCAYHLVVTRDNHISVTLLVSRGSPLIGQELRRVVASLDGNTGLTFPAGSKRQQAHEWNTIVCGTNVRPGFEWQHGDVEKIHLEW